VYLNSLRSAAGMTTLIADTNLDTAALNHSTYNQTNNFIGHFESLSFPTGFTGVTPADRVVAAGYLSTTVSENVSYGSADVNESIDGLMAAIYHRLGFLQDEIDEIGIGVSSNGLHYTYNMGNAALNTLCAGSSAGQGYFNVCADENKFIDGTAYDLAKANIANNNPEMVLWPYDNATDIPPVFYEESPDPLPDHGVSGYPVSVEFNDTRVTDSVTVQAFELYDETDSEVAYAREILLPAHDVNGQFTDMQFAIFPEERLDWGKKYRVQFNYTIGAGSAQSKSWYFTTRGLPHRYYQINGDTVSSFNVVSGQDYAIYFKPRNANDTLDGFGSGFDGGMTIVDDFLDLNTITTNVTGSIGQQVTYTFGNGQQLTLTVAASDTALDNTIVTDTDNDGFADPSDNCPNDSNADQKDTDNDDLGDVCDNDDDDDGFNDGVDNCPLISNDQLDTDGDTDGNACDDDDDNDGLTDIEETGTYNTDPLLADTDGDGDSDKEEVDNGTDPLNPPRSGAWRVILPLILNQD
jgi:hypothetical protein